MKGMPNQGYLQGSARSLCEWNKYGMKNINKEYQKKTGIWKTKFGKQYQFQTVMA
jgi:hypothetical protein